MGETIPPFVYWDGERRNFYSFRGRGMGGEFFRQWLAAKAEFPTKVPEGWQQTPAKPMRYTIYGFVSDGPDESGCRDNSDYRILLEAVGIEQRNEALRRMVNEIGEKVFVSIQIDTDEVEVTLTPDSPEG